LASQLPFVLTPESMAHSGVAYSTAGVPPAEQYTWSFPGSLTVKLNLQMVSRLQSRLGHVREGLLLGSGIAGGTEVMAFRPLSRDQSARLRVGQGPPASDRGPSPVGYFRVVHEGELRLSAEDLAVAESSFPNPHEIILLIQQSDGGAAKATFFFWDGGHMFGDFAFLEFPFDASVLSSMEAGRQTRFDAVQEPVQEPDSPDPPQASVQEQAPQNVRVQKNSIRMNLGRVQWLKAGALLVLLAVSITVFLRIFVGARSKTARPGSASASSSQSGSLGLRVENRRGDLLLKWNKAAVGGEGARGTLLIQDGPLPRAIPVEGSLLQAGNLVYSPTSNQIQIQLTVESPGKQQASEMMLVLVASGGPPEVQTLQQSRRKDEAPAVRAEVARQPLNLSRASLNLGTSSISKEAGSDLPGLTGPPPEAGGNAAEELRKALGTASALPPAPAENRQATPQKTATYHAPEIVSRVLPITPARFRGPTFHSETIKLTISLDENGRIAKITPEAPRRLEFLVSVATTAVQKWKFKPATIGERATASEIVLNFKFDPLR
jgi:hypothetical protein